MNMRELSSNSLNLELSTDELLMLADFGGLAYVTGDGIFVELTIEGAEDP